MDLDFLIKQVLEFKPTIKSWKNKFETNEYRLTSKLHELFFGTPLNRVKNCGCVDDFFTYIASLSQEKINLKKIQMENKFKLKSGIVLVLHGLNMELTSANITDEKAITLLKKYPVHIKSFESYPANWEELVELSNKPEPKIEEELGEIKDFGVDNVETPVESNELSLKELKKLDKKILRKMSNEVALQNGIDAPHHASRAEVFAKFIIENK